jgi:hypothetical protein
MPWRFQDRLGQQQTVGDDNRDIRVMCCEGRLRLGAFQARRRQHRQSRGLRKDVDRRLPLAHATPRRTRRLRIDRRHVVPRRYDLRQRRHREFGCPHEDDAHDSAFSYWRNDRASIGNTRRLTAHGAFERRSKSGKCI